jgi:cytochrome c-type biogenesis protein CcmF
LTGEKISVGAPFFNLTFGPIMAPLFLLMPIGQVLAWKRGDLIGALQRLIVAGVLALVVALIFAALQGEPVVSIIGTGAATWLIVGSFVEVAGRVFGRGASLGNAFARARGLPRSAWGAAFAHAGLGVTVLGLAATGWGVEKITTLKAGDVVDLGPYQVAVQSLETRPGPNYRASIARSRILRDGVVVADIEPARRFYPSRQMSTTEAGIATLGLGQVYVSLSNENPDGSLDGRLYWKPLVSLIWLGALIMGLGGALSLSDRRLRIGVAKRARAPSPSIQAAE